MRRRLSTSHSLTLLSIVLASTLSGCAKAPSPESIIAFVAEGQRAMFVRGELEPYQALWADDAKLITARGPEASPHDIVLHREQFLTTRKLWEGRPVYSAMTFSNPKVTLEGERASLQWLVTNPDTPERITELYLLKRQGDGWKVYENRFWDDTDWSQQDAAVETARKTGDQAELASRLYQAQRPKEALAALDGLPASALGPDQWSLRSWAHYQLGDSAAALKAACKAKNAGMKAEHLPKWTPNTCN